MRGQKASRVQGIYAKSATARDCEGLKGIWTPTHAGVSTADVRVHFSSSTSF